MATCPNCGETSDAKLYCPFCGAEFTEEGAATSSSRGNTRSDQSRQGSGPPRPPNQTGQGQTGRDQQSAESRATTRSEPEQSQSQSVGTRNDNKNVSSRVTGQQESATRESRESLLGGRTRQTAEPEVNDFAWSIGWRPLIPIGVCAGFFLVLGVGIDAGLAAAVGMAVIGVGIGTGIWYWGVSEINENYQSCRNAFYGRSAKRAEKRLGIEQNEVIDTFDFRSHARSSPPMVKPSKLYRADHMVLSDVSVSVDKDSKYNMKERETKSTGTTKNIYYDNIESITTNDEGYRTYLRIVTSRGENLRTATVDQSIAEDAQGRLRSKMREVRRGRQD